jgi:hypothetical protein
MVGAGIFMMIRGRDRAAPQINATPTRVSITHTLRF